MSYTLTPYICCHNHATAPTNDVIYQSSKRNSDKQNSTPEAQVNTAIQSNPFEVVQPTRSTAIVTHPFDSCCYTVVTHLQPTKLNLNSSLVHLLF